MYTDVFRAAAPSILVQSCTTRAAGVADWNEPAISDLSR
jgi:hypothetical protein